MLTLNVFGCVVCPIAKAVMKWKAGLGEKEIEMLIGETLKHAPAQTIKVINNNGQLYCSLKCQIQS